MKINYRTYPILKKLKDKKLGVIPIHKTDLPIFDVYKNYFNKSFKNSCENFSENIYYLTKPFIEASSLAEKSLTDLYGDIIKNDLSDFDVKGTFIEGDNVYFIDYQTKKGSEDQSICFMVFSKKGILLLFYVDGKYFDTGQPQFFMASYLGVPKNECRNAVLYNFYRIIIYSMFKNYADIETKYLKPKEKTKFVNCKYINETSKELTLLNSTWFTNLVMSDEFKVRGHFRLQPKKIDGDWTKELIWINEFKKKGYISKAKKTKLNV